jgi:HEAT repeat protein
MVGKRRKLLRALGEEDDAKRWEAAVALVDLCDGRTVDALEGMLEDEGEDASRAAAAYVLGFSGEPDAAPVLARTLADPTESTAVRAYAAEALGHLLQHETVLAEVRTAILAGLRAPAPEVRFWSAFAAGVLGLQESRVHLARLAGTDHEEVEGWWTVAEEAEWALRVLDGEEDPPLPERAPEANATPAARDDG